MLADIINKKMQENGVDWADVRQIVAYNKRGKETQIADVTELAQYSYHNHAIVVNGHYGKMLPQKTPRYFEWKLCIVMRRGRLIETGFESLIVTLWDTLNDLLQAKNKTMDDVQYIIVQNACIDKSLFMDLVKRHRSGHEDADDVASDLALYGNGWAIYRVYDGEWNSSFWRYTEIKDKPAQTIVPKDLSGVK